MLDSTAHWTNVWVALAALGALSVLLTVCACAAFVLGSTASKWDRAGGIVWLVATLGTSVLAFHTLT